MQCVRKSIHFLTLFTLVVKYKINVLQFLYKMLKYKICLVKFEKTQI